MIILEAKKLTLCLDPHKLKKFHYNNLQNYQPKEYTAWKQNDQQKTKIKASYPYMTDTALEN